jgi:hypothetical protein
VEVVKTYTIIGEHAGAALQGLRNLMAPNGFDTYFRIIEEQPDYVKLESKIDLDKAGVLFATLEHGLTNVFGVRVMEWPG